MIRVLLVDDDELVRVGFRMLLDAESDITVVAEADNGATALEAVTSRACDVVLMDIRMPKVDGLDATRRMAAPDGPRVLILTTFDLDEYAFEALKAGASGFIVKNTPPQDLVSAIRSVHAGNAVVAPTTTRRLIDRFSDRLHRIDRDSAPQRLKELTPREHEVLLHIAHGLTNAEIADRLYVSEGTIKTHVGRVLAKLGLRDRVQAVIFAYENELING